MQTGARIVTDFVAAVDVSGHYKITRTSLSQNVFQISGDADVLIYVKGRAEEPYTWGVTANVITRLEQQEKKWFVVLLYESKNTGYFLPASDVLEYMQTTWPLGADGDYKPATGGYLRNHQPFFSFATFLELMDQKKNKQRLVYQIRKKFPTKR